MTIKTLVVENNPVLLRAITAFLERMGCSVRSAENGLDALELLQTYRPDVLFTDLVMPLVGGEQLCKILRKSKIHSGVYIVIISGIVLEDMENILSQKYYDICIAKGTLQELKLALGAALESYAAASTGERGVSPGQPQIPEGLQPSAVAEELLSERKHLYSILENLEEGIAEISQDGRFVSINSAGQRILQVSAEELIGLELSYYSWGNYSTQVGLWLDDHLSGRSKRRFDIQEDAPLHLGTRVVTASFIPAKGGGSDYALCIFRDITRQYRAEQKEKGLNKALRLVTKMDAMSCMAGGIAHDFNNLLTVICGNLDILYHSGQTTPAITQQKVIENARSAAYIAVDLTRKISHFSPYGIVRRTDIDLSRLVSSVVEEFSSATGACCDVKMRENARVSVDEEQLSIALKNILQNGFEADSGGEVKVATGIVEFPAPELISGQYVSAGKYGMITVADEGAGIPKEHLVKIFDPYFSTKSRGAMKGMGLGLTVAYATFRSHGGYVVIESSVGRGTVVTCYLPDFTYEKRAVPEMTDSQEGTPGVLIIDADPWAADMEGVLLEMLKCTPVLTRSLAEAKSRLQEMKAGGSSVGCVLVDPHSIGAIDHQKLCEELHEIVPALKIIITSGAVMDQAMVGYQQYGYANALPKPVTMDNLRHALFTVEQQ